MPYELRHEEIEHQKEKRKTKDITEKSSDILLPGMHFETKWIADDIVVIIDWRTLLQRFQYLLYIFRRRFDTAALYIYIYIFLGKTGILSFISVSSKK